MLKISIVTPSIRPTGMSLVTKSLSQQTFREFEHLVDSSQEKNEGDYWGVYKAYNRLVRQAQAPLVISIQDFTSFKSDALERFYEHFIEEPETIVGAVGNKYSDDTFTVMTWNDPRPQDGVSYRDCNYQEIEWNLCAVPKAAIYAVGGFDEEWGDRHSSICGLDVLARLEILGGWKFKLDESINSYSLEHGRLPGWEAALPLYNGEWTERLKYYLKNPILPYLQL